MARHPQLLLSGLVRVFTRRTKTTLDDVAIAAVRRPLFLGVLAIGVAALLRGAPTEAWSEAGVARYEHACAIILGVLVSVLILLLESGGRGVVTDIGMRSTRLVTRDDIEIPFPQRVVHMQQGS